MMGFYTEDLPRSVRGTKTTVLIGSAAFIGGSCSTFVSAQRIVQSIMLWSCPLSPGAVILGLQLKSLIPSSSEFDTLQEAYGLTPADGVEFLVFGSLINRPPPGKVSVYLKTFDAGLYLPLTDFQE
ncbi:unnamed protein product [Lactuca saligna]|uniref:Uncharacterized protein n=1 Tax=Lactuca saligna TaxID=75948 RepID=A0AA35ZT93_LACSI|nr:unnamed protein product [Lactuca saligna]